MYNLSIKEILHKYSFKHRFYIEYALYCAKYANAKVEPLPEALKAIAIVEAYLLGKATKEDCRVAAAANAAYAAHATHAASNAAAYAASAAAHAADAAANAAYAAAHAAYAANAAYAAYAAHAAYAANAAYAELKEVLIDKINSLGELELMFLEVK